MKNLFILLLLTLSLNSFAIEDSTINQEITQAERIIDKYSGKISASIEKLYDSTAPEVKKLWTGYVFYIRAYGIMFLLLLAFAIGLSAYVFVKNSRKPFISEYDDITQEGLHVLISGAALIIFIITFFIQLDDLLRDIIVPEISAIEEILRLIK